MEEIMDRIERHVNGREQLPTMDSIDELIAEKIHLEELLNLRNKNENIIDMQEV